MKSVASQKVNLLNLERLLKPMLETYEPKQPGRPVELHQKVYIAQVGASSRAAEPNNATDLTPVERSSSLCLESPSRISCLPILTTSATSCHAGGYYTTFAARFVQEFASHGEVGAARTIFCVLIEVAQIMRVRRSADATLAKIRVYFWQAKLGPLATLKKRKPALLQFATGRDSFWIHGARDGIEPSTFMTCAAGDH